jgi:hypothetical protein
MPANILERMRNRALCMSGVLSLHRARIATPHGGATMRYGTLAAEAVAVHELSS